MFKNKNTDGSNNISGRQIAILRKAKDLSQRALADEMQLIGLDIGKNTIQQIESGQRFVTDLELAYFSYYFRVKADDLLDFDDEYIIGDSISAKVAEKKKEY